MDATKEGHEEDTVTMAIQTATKPEGPTGESKSDVLIDDTPPSAKMLDRAGALMVLDADKKKYSFKSLYEGKGRVLVVFLRHFFCGVGLPSLSQTTASGFCPSSVHPFIERRTHKKRVTELPRIHSHALYRSSPSNPLRPTYPNIPYTNRLWVYRPHSLLQARNKHPVPNLRGAHWQAIRGFWND